MKNEIFTPYQLLFHLVQICYIPAKNEQAHRKQRFETVKTLVEQKIFYDHKLFQSYSWEIFVLSSSFNEAYFMFNTQFDGSKSGFQMFS